MDFYLQSGNSYRRIEDEFKKYGKLIFCVDFDDTIYDFHKRVEHMKISSSYSIDGKITLRLSSLLEMVKISMQ